jgi:hypothetical protein
MHDSQRYRDNAADCLLAARNAREQHYKSINLLMAQAWLLLATEDAAVDHLLAKWEAEETLVSIERHSWLEKKPPGPSVTRRDKHAGDEIKKTG